MSCSFLRLVSASNLLAIALFLLASSLPQAGSAMEPVDCSRDQTYWSQTEPSLNLVHIFCGEINSRGKPVGYHARFQGKDPDTARVTRILDPANDAGVYTARIEVRDNGSWKEKFSSFFPDRLDQGEVVRLILSAYEESGGGQRWEGVSGAGFRVQGYEIEVEGETRINTAYPLYQR